MFPIFTLISQFDKYRLMATAAGQERVFAFTGYLSHMLHHLLTLGPWMSLQMQPGYPAPLKGKTKLAAPHTIPVKHRLLALSMLMSETRYTLRLLGVFQLWTGGSKILRYPPCDPVLHSLKLLQLVVDVVYQVLENVGYLASKGIIAKRFVEQRGGVDKWYLQSRRFWFGHIILQLISLWREGVVRKTRIVRNPVDERDAGLQAEIRTWKQKLISNICWSPLFLHWCFEKGIGFPDKLSGALGATAGAWSFYDMWAATGDS